jgi:hypothetical protein
MIDGVQIIIWAGIIGRALILAFRWVRLYILLIEALSIPFIMIRGIQICFMTLGILRLFMTPGMVRGMVIHIGTDGIMDIEIHIMLDFGMGIMRVFIDPLEWPIVV